MKKKQKVVKTSHKKWLVKKCHKLLKKPYKRVKKNSKKWQTSNKILQADKKKS